MACKYEHENDNSRRLNFFNNFIIFLDIEGNQTLSILYHIHSAVCLFIFKFAKGKLPKSPSNITI